MENKFVCEEKWDKDDEVPDVCSPPQPTEDLKPSSSSGDAEEASGGDSFNPKCSREVSPSSAPSPVAPSSDVPSVPDATDVPVETEKYFTCDQFPDVTAAPKEIKPRSKRSLKKYYSWLKANIEDEEIWKLWDESHEEKRKSEWTQDKKGEAEEMEKKQNPGERKEVEEREDETEGNEGGELASPFDINDIVEMPRESSIRTWRPDYFQIVTPVDALPFYYHLYQIPAAINVLPLSYLVASQNNLSESALRIGTRFRGQGREPLYNSSGAYSHPHINERSGQNMDEDGHRFISSPSYEVDGVESVAVNAPRTAEDQGENDDEEENPRPALVDFVSPLTHTPMTDYTIPNIKGNSEVEIHTFDFVSFIRRKRLPFCELDEIRKAWNKGNFKSLEYFVKMMMDSKVDEIFENITPYLPFADEVILKRELRALLNSQNSPEDAYDAVIELIKTHEIHGFKERESSTDDPNDLRKGRIQKRKTRKHRRHLMNITDEKITEDVTGEQESE